MIQFIPWNVSISISFEAFQSVHMPCIVVSILMDVFFVFCMVSPMPEQQRMKQPLFALIGSLVGCNTALNFFALLFSLSSVRESDSYGFYDIIGECLLFTMRTSITSCLWLNVFYYCQIVPAQHAFIIMVKRNIKLVVYSALIIDKVFFFEGFVVQAVYDKYLLSHRSNTNHYNSTYINVTMYAFMTNIWLRLPYLLISLCVMMASGCATISYLRRHMKCMEKSRRSSSRLRSQMRVTITGIIQTLLYLLCSVWIMTDDLAYHFTTADFDKNAYIICTVITLYSFGTNINLCVGQTVFREQVLLLWQQLCENISLAQSMFYTS